MDIKYENRYYEINQMLWECVYYIVCKKQLRKGALISLALLFPSLPYRRQDTSFTPFCFYRNSYRFC